MANKKKAKETQVDRVSFAKQAYPKFCQDLVKKNAWTSHITVEESTAYRTPYLPTGRKKGKSPLVSTLRL